MSAIGSEHATSEASAQYEQAPCGLLSLDAALRVRHINDTLLGWLGRDRSEYEQLAAGGHPDFPTLARMREAGELQSLREHLHELQSTGRAVPLQLRLWGKDGGFFSVELISHAVREAGGRFACTRTAVIDISARERIEHQLVARLRLLQAITDRTPSRLAYYDKDLICRFCNAAYAAGYGLPADDVIGLSLDRVLSPQVLPDVLPRVARVLNGESISHEAEREGNDGTQRYFEVHYIPDRRDDEVPGFFIELIDITERRRTEDFVFNANLDLEERVAQRSAELHASEQRFRLMSDTIRDHAIFFVDADGAVADWSDSAQRLYGFDYGQIVGRSLDALFHAEDRAHAPVDAQLLLDQCFANGQAEFQGWSSRVDGTLFWSHATLTALRNERDELQGISVIVRDLTETKRLADVTAELHRELELRVRQRTAQLDAAHRDLDAFSYTVAHDLRAPLRHIIQYVSLTQEVLEPEARHDLLQYQTAIGNAARRMSQMIDGLLEFARLGRVPIQAQPVPLSPLVQGIAGHLNHQSAPRAIEWVIDPLLPTVSGDPILLAEVFGKLLDNAVKFTRRADIARIEVGHLPGEAGSATVFVRDNGVGFDLGKAKSLFLMFQRQHHSMDYEGMGMGLALAQRIVQRHDGRIWCQSAPGEGCTFFVALPHVATTDTPHATP